MALFVQHCVSLSKVDHPTEPMPFVTRLALTILAAGTIASFVPDSAFAYGGPGSIMSGLGALLAAIAALLASLFGFVWFPIKRLLRKMREDNPEPVSTSADEPME